MNAGDYRLYVGGGAINRAFANVLQEAKHDISAYKSLHSRLLEKALGDPDGVALFEGDDLGESAADILVACACVPEGDFQSKRNEGFAAVSLFKENRCPLDARNVGMCYVVGPFGVVTYGGKEASMTREEFLDRVEVTARSAVRASNMLNHLRAAKKSWLKVEVLRLCLVSGGVYKHPEVQTKEVAAAILKGARSAFDPNLSPTLEFAYDNDVFAEAFKELEGKQV